MAMVSLAPMPEQLQQAAVARSMLKRPAADFGDPAARPLRRRRLRPVADDDVAMGLSVEGDDDNSSSSSSSSTTIGSLPSTHATSSPSCNQCGKAPCSAPSKPASSSIQCDKCDGPHRTEECPHFPNAREQHKDAWAQYGKDKPARLGESGGDYFLEHGRTVHQPPDGHCLFHSLCYGLHGGQFSGDARRARSLRKELSQFLKENPGLEISGDTLEEWVRWDTNNTVAAYARQMSASTSWGGGIEIAVCSHVKRVNIHVYEHAARGGFKRISCFESPEPTNRTVHLLYQGGLHYDALVPY